jgi:hypothetical protein
VLAPGGGGGRMRVAGDEPVGPSSPGASTQGLRGGGRVRVAALGGLPVPVFVGEHPPGNASIPAGKRMAI